MTHSAKYLIQTPCGPVQGCAGQVTGTAAYKGIRYATAGRWEYPVQVTGWEGVYDATAYGHCGYQARAFYDESKNPKKHFYYNEFRKGETYTYSDDCLFLNVFTPEGAGIEGTAGTGEGLPVIVYIHGGSFTGGCGFEKHFDGPQWPLHGVIAVTLNYRLGPWGFLCMKELEEEAGHTGHYGLYDQLTAIRWVKDNISAFGGNPENITIMGQSAGAMSVQIHCESPMTEGLFQKAVLSSGCGMSSMLAGNREKSSAYWAEVMKRCGCTTLEEFRALPAETLYTVWQETKKEVKGGAMAVFPIKDGLLVPGKSHAHKKHLACMAGSTSHDIAAALTQPLARGWCRKNAKSAYVWYFDRYLPGDDNGAWHSSDLWYWFGTLNNCWRPMEEKDQKVSGEMVAYLCNFAKSGDPNGSGLAEWKETGTGQKKVMMMGEEESRMGTPPLMKLIRIMLTNKAVGE